MRCVLYVLRFRISKNAAAGVREKLDRFDKYIYYTDKMAYQ